MKNRLLIPILIVASSASALAGLKSAGNVLVTSSTAYGAMGSARNSADTLQYIGCELYATTTYSNFHCRARNAANVTLHCWNDARAYPHMTAAVTAMTAGSWVRFSVDPTAADPTRCTWIDVENHSKYAPPQP